MNELENEDTNRRTCDEEAVGRAIGHIRGDLVLYRAEVRGRVAVVSALTYDKVF